MIRITKKRKRSDKRRVTEVLEIKKKEKKIGGNNSGQIFPD